MLYDTLKKGSTLKTALGMFELCEIVMEEIRKKKYSIRIQNQINVHILLTILIIRRFVIKTYGNLFLIINFIKSLILKCKTVC